MKQATLFIFALLVSSFWFLPSKVPHIGAQDTQVENVTKRRPDRTPEYSPSIVSTSPTREPDVTQIETSNQSFFAMIWEKIRAFFASLLSLPEASSTTAP